MKQARDEGNPVMGKWCCNCCRSLIRALQIRSVCLGRSRVYFVNDASWDCFCFLTQPSMLRNNSRSGHPDSRRLDWCLFWKMSSEFGVELKWWNEQTQQLASLQVASYNNEATVVCLWPSKNFPSYHCHRLSAVCWAVSRVSTGSRNL